MSAPAPVIRDPRQEDEASWRRLWAGYVAFYEAEVSEAITAATWQRLFMPGSGIFGRLAECDGAVSGFTISVVHPGTWTLAPRCYLEDLFVDPNMRGRGLGGARLVTDLLAYAPRKRDGTPPLRSVRESRRFRSLQDCAGLRAAASGKEQMRQRRMDANEQAVRSAGKQMPKEQSTGLILDWRETFFPCSVNMPFLGQGDRYG
jgi:GNAT superfamily N-acetyltransferase